MTLETNIEKVKLNSLRNRKVEVLFEVYHDYKNNITVKEPERILVDNKPYAIVDNQILANLDRDPNPNITEEELNILQEELIKL